MRPGFKSVVLAAALLVAAGGWESALAREGGPFTAFSGAWRGSGRVTTKDGKSDPINCRASYEISPEGAELTQSLVCAADSYRFDIHTHVIADGTSFSGTWQETTRNVSGNLTGRIGGGDFEGHVDGPGFQAGVSLRLNGKRQTVDIKPAEGDITSVQVSLSH